MIFFFLICLWQESTRSHLKDMILSHKKCAFFQNPEYEQSDTIFKHLPILLFSLNHK